MSETQLLPADLGSDIDIDGNRIENDQTDNTNEIDVKGATFEEAFSQVDQIKQQAALPYIELRKKIGELPTFEKRAINDILANYFASLPEDKRDLIKSADVAQILSGSSKPLNQWISSQFYTDDGELEKFVLGKIKPAVDGMTEDLREHN